MNGGVINSGGNMSGNGNGIRVLCGEVVVVERGMGLEGYEAKSKEASC